MTCSTINSEDHRVLDSDEIESVSGGRCESSEAVLLQMECGTLVVGYRMCGGIAMPYAHFTPAGK